MGQGVGILAFLFVALLVHSASQGTPNEQLLALDTEGSSAAIFVTSRGGSYNHFYHFPTGLSPACSADRTSRCWQLVVDTSLNNGKGEKFVVLAALDDAVGLMEFQYDGARLLLANVHVLNVTESVPLGQCVPLEIVPDGSQFKLLCSYDRQNLAFCEIYLDRSNISRSSLSHCISRSFHTIINYQQVSNVVPFPETRRMLVVVQGEVYGIGEFDFRHFGSLQDGTCDRISYATNHILYAYCRSGKVIEHDIDTESPDPHLPHEGVPIACPPPYPRFTVVQGEHDIIVRHSSGVQQRIEGRNYSSALCSKSGNLFVSDQLGGVTVVNASSGSSQSVDESIRSQHLEVFDDDYLVVVSADPQKTLLYDKFLMLIAERSGGGKALGVISNLETTNSLFTVEPTSSPVTMERRVLNLSAIIGSSVGVLLVVMSGVIVLIIVIIALAATGKLFKLARRPSVPQGRRRCPGGTCNPDPESHEMVTVAEPDSTTNPVLPDSSRGGLDGGGDAAATPVVAVDCTNVRGPTQQVI